MEFKEGRYTIRIIGEERHDDGHVAADIYVTVREDEPVEVVDGAEGRLLIKKAINHRYKVNQSRLSSNGYFATFFASRLTQEVWDTTPITKGENVSAAARFLLRRLHGVGPNPGEMQLHLKDVRMIPVIYNEWKLDHPKRREKQEKWFTNWVAANSTVLTSTPQVDGFPDSQCDLDLFLTGRAFNHAKLCLAASKRLVYESEFRINTGRLYARDDTKAPIRVVQQLNAAKVRLRNNLQRMIFDVPSALLDKDCSCSSAAFRGYMCWLNELKLWPSFEKSQRHNSLLGIVNILQNRSCGNLPGCQLCRIDFNSKVRQAIRVFLNDFQGLCIDCCEKVREDVRDAKDSKEYKNIVSSPGVYGQNSTWWSKLCREDHSEMTWYFSWHARLEVRRFGA